MQIKHTVHKISTKFQVFPIGKLSLESLIKKKKQH